MKKYNYTVSVEAPSKQIADMLMEYICKDNYDLIEIEKISDEEKEKEPAQPNYQEAINKGLMEFQKVAQIVSRCLLDETALDRIADALGINSQPKNENQ